MFYYFVIRNSKCFYLFISWKQKDCFLFEIILLSSDKMYDTTTNLVFSKIHRVDNRSWVPNVGGIESVTDPQKEYQCNPAKPYVYAAWKLFESSTYEL